MLNGQLKRENMSFNNHRDSLLSKQLGSPVKHHEAILNKEILKRG